MNSFEQDTWHFLNEFTQARIAIGRAGTSLPTHFLLDFRLAHAKARDAVYSNLDKAKICQELQLDLPILELHTKIIDRLDYLKNPNLGRRLDDTSVNKLAISGNFDIVFVVADGLSATAVNTHSAFLLNQVIPYLQAKRWAVAPICLVEQGRVACADEIAELLKAKIAVIFIGERPGLSAADSLGIYITFEPKVGLTDEKRNCISNVRPEGMDYEKTIQKLIYLLETINARQLSGVNLKDEQELIQTTETLKMM